MDLNEKGCSLVSAVSEKALPPYDEIGTELKSWLQFTEQNIGNAADHSYGIIYDKNSEHFKMGSFLVKFQYNDILINGIQYPGSPGLFELIFVRKPRKYLLTDYKDEDLESYKRMLLQTKSYINCQTGLVKGSSGLKYKNIIRPLINGVNDETKQKRVSTYPFRKRLKPNVLPERSNESQEGEESFDHVDSNEINGRKLYDVLEFSKIDYSSWDDPNQLVDRLRLLITSKGKMGNTDNDNEIMTILNELKQAGIIKDFGTFTL